MTAARSKSGNGGATASAALPVYLCAVVAAGALVLAHSSVAAAHAPQPFVWLVLAGLAIVTGFFKLNFASISASIFVSDTFFITIALLFGPAPATVAIAVDSFVICIRRREPWRRLAFNTAAPALSLWVASRAGFAIAGVAPLIVGKTPIGALAVPLLSLALVYFLLNSGLTATAVALDSRASAIQIWRRHFMWLSVGYLASASAAFCLILLIQQVSLAAAVMVLPLLAVFHLTLRSSFGRLEDARRHLGDLDRLYLSTIETLAMAIDAKDDVTHSHVRRVQAYAVGLAAALGVEDDEGIKAIKAAALLHDTGKLAVPEHILNKPGKLTESEFEKMKLHVDVGADILSLVEFPYPVVPIVRCHHESWDGSGYPRGVKGEDIPIGARILSVVDCYDALTSDRPYRRAMTEEAALNILRERSGTMYDPRVVDTFVAIHRDIEVGEADTPEHRAVLRKITSSRSAPPAPADAAGAPASPAAAGAAVAASNDVLAFVSLARIASGDGSVADVLALSSSLIADILPTATGAWYLPDAGRTDLTVSEAFGPAAHVLRGTTIGMGQRLTGWVAASRQAIVNSDAALDLEALAEQVAPALRSCMSVPLLTGDTFVGVLSLYSVDADVFDENRGRLIQMIAPHIAGALHAASRHAAAAKDSVRHADKPVGGSGRDLRLVSTR
ncbi:MAG TPA: HD domain-containing phosphohydrolase [Vicinamibacterales bacterium]|nr:HD domain-containing phosphohydrolase [Vicinamibacterales bacterium]